MGGAYLTLFANTSPLTILKLSPGKPTHLLTIKNALVSWKTNTSPFSILFMPDNLLCFHHSLSICERALSLKKNNRFIHGISNGEFGTCSFCLNPNNFTGEIYPRLIELERRGIDVICIGGDIGKKVKRFEYITSEGIQFLASGIQFDDKENDILVFCHDVEKHELNWEFVNIETLF